MPASAEAASSPKAKSSQSAKTVDRKLKSTNKTLDSTRKSLTSTRRSLAKSNADIAKMVKDLGALNARLGSTEGGLGALLTAAPTLVNGLQQLSTAVQGTIAPNLTKLGDAVTNEIAPGLKAAGEGLAALKTNLTTLGGTVTTIGTNLGTLSTSVSGIADAVNDSNTGLAAVNTRQQTAAAGAAATEFGVARVFRNRGGTLTPLGTVWTSDIPDDGNNAAIASGTVVDQGCQAGDTYVAYGAIRTSETDGSGNPAGQVGGSLIVTAATGDFLTAEQTAPNPTYGPAVVDVTTGSSKNSNDPAADGSGGVEIVETGPIAAGGPVCIVEGNAQFFDFQENGGSVVD